MFLSQPAADCGKGKVLGLAGLVSASMRTGKEGPLAFTEYTESRYSVPGDKPETENRGRLACKVCVVEIYIKFTSRQAREGCLEHLIFCWFNENTCVFKKHTIKTHNHGSSNPAQHK